MRHEPGTGQHDHHLHKTHGEIGERCRRCHEAVGIQLRLPVVLVVAGKKLALMVLVGKGLHHADATDIGLYARIEIRHPPVEVTPGDRHVLSVMRGEKGGKRHDDGRHQRHGYVHPQHDGESTDQRHDGNEQIFRPMMRNLPDLLQVLRQPRHQPARALIVEITNGQRLQMIESFSAHLGLDIDSEHMTPIGDDDLQARIDQVDHQESDSRHCDQTEFIGRQEPINEQRHGQWEGKLQKARDHGAGEVQNKELPVRAIVGGKAPKDRGHEWDSDLLRRLGATRQ